MANATRIHTQQGVRIHPISLSTWLRRPMMRATSWSLAASHATDTANPLVTKVIPRRMTDPTDEGSVFPRFNFEQAKTANAAATPGSHNDGRTKNLLQFTISRHHERIKITHIMKM
ncbi:MAG: hypothetical protein ACFNPU_11655 [Corynebacterium matruchotii]|uniref:hypothetical protein n=1 Tax=Corynebacterium matruchotii TaxID=43768 RepID=UPI00360BA16B